MADVSVPCEQANHQQGKAAMLKKHLSRFHWGSALLTPVSYTHLTLPTILRV